MDLRTALLGVSGYSHSLGKSQLAQQHLWQIPRDAPAEVPIGLTVRVSGSGRSLPVIPWIALLNPDVTTTATDGLYLVYLYSRSLQTVYLTMNQGATQHRLQAEAQGLKGRAAEDAAIEEISEETAALRGVLHPSVLTATLAVIDLGEERFLPRAYEAGSIAALSYTLADLPDNSRLAEDLAEFSLLYSQCVTLKDQLAANRQVRTSSRSAKQRAAAPTPTPVFKPKDSSEYVAQVQGSTQRRSRTHEALVKEFGEAVIASGRRAATNVHPRDLTVDGVNSHWLVEAKTVGANAEPAVREAIGQLFSYRHFYYRDARVPDPHMLALFSSPIGAAFEALLTSLDIEVVCRDGGTWTGTQPGLELLT